MSNWLWLKELASALNEEYKYRFNRQVNHKSYDVIACLGIPPVLDYGVKKRPQIVPDELKQDDSVNAYRQYYKIHKRHLGHWTKRDTPGWFLETN